MTDPGRIFGSDFTATYYLIVIQEVKYVFQVFTQ